MKKDLRMNAKSPDPDDLAQDQLPESSNEQRHDGGKAAKDDGADRSAPHVPPMEKGRIKGE